jgi:hypothetical protein
MQFDNNLHFQQHNYTILYQENLKHIKYQIQEARQCIATFKKVNSAVKRLKQSDWFILDIKNVILSGAQSPRDCVQHIGIIWILFHLIKSLTYV